MHVSDLSIMCLSCMEEAWHLIEFAALVLLAAEDGWHELVQTWGVILLVDHVKASHQVRVILLGNPDVVEDLVGEAMGITNHLVAHKNKTYFKLLV